MQRKGAFAVLLPALLGIVLWAGDAAPAQAQQRRCPTFDRTRITVTPVFEKVKRDFRRSFYDLRDMAEAHAVKGPGGGMTHNPVGLAVGELFVSVGVTKTSRSFSDTGWTCAAASEISVEIGFRNNTVYVADELPRGTCIHQEVLDHELTHVRTDRELLEDNIPQVEAYFRRAVENLGIVQDASPASAFQSIDAYFSDATNDFTAAMGRERDRRQQGVDTADEYARVNAACDGQLGKLLAKAGVKLQ